MSDPSSSSTSSGRKISAGNEIVILAFRLYCLPQSQEPAEQNWFVVVEAQDWVAAQLEVGLFVQGSQRFPLRKKLLATLRPPPNALHTQTTQCTNLFSFTTTNPRPKSASSTKNDATPKLCATLVPARGKLTLSSRAALCLSSSLSFLGRFQFSNQFPPPLLTVKMYKSRPKQQ